MINLVRDAGMTLNLFFLSLFRNQNSVVRWTHKDQTITSDGSQSVSVLSNGMLRIKHVTKQENGMYFCTVGPQKAVFGISVKGN